MLVRVQRLPVVTLLRLSTLLASAACHFRWLPFSATVLIFPDT